jgi:hypothetical protein
MTSQEMKNRLSQITTLERKIEALETVAQLEKASNFAIESVATSTKLTFGRTSEGWIEDYLSGMRELAKKMIAEYKVQIQEIEGADVK